MKVVGQDRIAEQINAKGRSELLQIHFDPNLAMIKILARDSIIAHQEAASDGPILDMNNGNVCRVKHLCTSQANHHVPSFLQPS